MRHLSDQGVFCRTTRERDDRGEQSLTCLSFPLESISDFMYFETFEEQCRVFSKRPENYFLAFVIVVNL